MASRSEVTRTAIDPSGVQSHRVCARCVMDTTAADIQFDHDGVCSYCEEFVAKLTALSENDMERAERRQRFISEVKTAGKGKRFDCIVGVSGGVDSSYVLYLACQEGLRPLAVHLDNGWNSELAVHNIANVVQGLGVDLVTHVIDWDENRDLQRAFIRANVVDVELLMDNAMLALNYQQASANRVRYILTGDNTATEGMRLPPGWYHHKFDKRNIRAIHKRYGTIPIRTHPLMSTLDFVWYEMIRGIRRWRFLDLYSYEKSEAVSFLQRELGYKPYPYKHYESVFTRFYQAYILPRKFGFDKRRVHLSSLIMTGQTTRDEALQLLESSPFESPRLESIDRAYVLKKLALSQQEFDDYIRAPGVPHEAYPSEASLNRALVRAYKKARQALS
jgi:N-acetyl sugar amidotransferase